MPNPTGPRRPIALLVNILSSGGAQRRIATLANRFIALGRAVDVVTVLPNGPMAALLDAQVCVTALAPASTPAQRSMRAWRPALEEYLATTEPSVLMACVTDVHRLAVEAGTGRTPVVLRASRQTRREFPRWQVLGRLLERIREARKTVVYARADAIIVLSESNADAIRQQLRDRRVPIEVIHNPVLTADRLAAPGPPLPRNPVPLILGVGRLTAQKDFHTLLRAFALVREVRPARLVLLGEGEDRRSLLALARRLGIADDVAMPGEVDDVFERLRQADLFVSSSAWEAVQSALVEALAAGCPVVATDYPGARDVLDGRGLGPLVPVRQPRPMAAAMLAQLDNPIAPDVLAAGAARFAVDGKAEAYLRLFDTLQR